MCIQQTGDPGEHQLRLHYFEYPIKEDSEPFNVFSSKDDEWTTDHETVQANHHSMILWFKDRQDN